MDHPLPDKRVQEVAVLFSGGRDSSLAACLFALKGYRVHLLSFVSGIGIKSEISDYRFDELQTRFPQNIVGRMSIPIFGLFRKIAILHIEDDFAKYKVNLILVGEKMAMHAAAIVYCRQHGIAVLADGTSGYQQDMPEQMPEAVRMLQAFHRNYGIEYVTPILSFKSDDDVKYVLMEVGLSTKSLEGISIFAESFSTPAPSVLQAYIEEKLPVCEQYIDLMQGKRNTIDI